MHDTPRNPVASLLRVPFLVLFAATAAVFLWMALVTAPSFERAAGAKLLDGRIGYTAADVADLHQRLAEVLAAHQLGKLRTGLLQPVGAVFQVTQTAIRDQGR